ncbi:pyrimidine 5'-nucleotidase [Fibrobacter sp.]|uniref:pyrimidine 5'-nucleotidase n=1 Tax=Fibrobacter sp. TaxID=35828 RepID=UPI0025BAC96C|nr:pyrimidine 5'-nucleotidase [Fibrobacter sp.]MBR3071917.1 pyrimidine 5'-nucleotidase [Fibrobacter sp.]
MALNVGIRNDSSKIWLFDYDLTLYGEEERFVLNSLDHRISLFVQKVVGCDFETAHKVRTDYLERFGTTLSGLMALHHTNPEDFFDFIHEPEFLIYPKVAPEKLTLLKSLAGHRYVFTNGRGDWSRAGMAHMQIDCAIEDVFDLKLMNWEGKPHASAYEKIEKWLESRGVLAKDSLDKSQIVLLEDSLRNLEPAHERGWTTILVNPNIQAPSWVDFHIPHLLNLKEELIV